MVRGGEFDMKYSKLHWGERRDGAVSDDISVHQIHRPNYAVRVKYQG